MSFPNFDWQFDYSKTGAGTPHQMMMAMDRFATHIMEGTHAPFCLTLCGPSGTGKTHLCKRLQRVLTNCGFISWATWCARGFTEADINYLSRFNFPLVLDEAFIATGAERDRQAVMEARALVGILEARANKWTVLTTNASLKQIQAQDERLYSRLIRAGNFVLEISPDTADFAKMQITEAAQ